MKIVLIMPGRGQIAGKMDERSKPWLPPSSLLAVAGATDPHHEIVLIDELAKGPITLENLPEADLYALGGLSTSRKGAFRLAKMIHQIGKPIVAGGMDVTGQFYEGRQTELLKYYDAIVIGRLTKRLWRKVLHDCAVGLLQDIYQADSYEPWEFQMPRYDLINPKDYFLPAAVQTSAGCNEACPFCTVHLVVGARRTMFLKPPAMLEQELALLPDTRFFIDYSDSFGIDLDHTREILPLFKNTGRGWFCEITVKNLLGIGKSSQKERPVLIGTMAKHGCKGDYIGIETIDGKVSAKSQSVQTYEEAVKRIHDAGEMVLGSFIFDVRGDEDQDIFQRTVEWVVKNKLDFVQYSLLALLPGSETRRIALASGRIIDNNPEHLDGAWPTIEHPIPPQARIEGLHYAYRETHSLSNIWRRIRSTPLGLRFIAAAANFQVHRTIAGWEKRGTYDHWLATREEISP